MKKFTILFLAICLAGGTVMAQDGLGLYAGADFTIFDFEDAGDNMFIRPYVGIDKALGALDVYAEAGFDIPLSDGPGMGLDVNAGVNYNLAFGGSSKLTVGGGLWILFPFDENKPAIVNSPFGIYITSNLSLSLELAAKFTQTMGFGDLYFELQVPFLLVEKNYDPFDLAELNLTAGVDTTMGLGAGLTLHTWIGSKDFNPDFLQGFDIFANYTTGPIFAGVTVGVPLVEDGIKRSGISITPEVEYSLDFGLSVSAALYIDGIASDGDTSIGLTIGAKYKF